MAERPLRVLGFGDGRSIIFLRWAWRLAERGHEVHIVSHRLSPHPGELEGLTAHQLLDLDLRLRIPGLRRLYFSRAIGALAKRLDVDLLHGHYLLPYGYWAARSGFHPLVLSPWGTDVLVHARDRDRGRRLVQEALSEADAVVLSSQGNAKAAIKLGAAPERVRQIVWYADLRPFGPDKRNPWFSMQFGWPANVQIVLSLRNYRPDTNLDVLIRAFAQIAPEAPQARLLLAARGGPLRKSLATLVAELGLEDHVAFHFLSSPELPRACASAALAVSLASSDATPASMLECMASGLPLVMGDAVTIDEWVTQGEGAEIVPCRNQQAVAVALRKLLSDSALSRAYGERNRRVVHERLGDPVESLESLYYQLLEERR